MAASTRRVILGLYKQLLRESKKITDYNFRNYAIRRTRDAFKDNKSESDASNIQALIKKAQENLDLLKRQAAISQMFSADKLVIESQAGHTH